MPPGAGGAGGSERDGFSQRRVPSPLTAGAGPGRAGPLLSGTAARPAFGVELQPPSAPARAAPPRPARAGGTQRAARRGALSWRSPGE